MLFKPKLSAFSHRHDGAFASVQLSPQRRQGRRRAQVIAQQRMSAFAVLPLLRHGRGLPVVFATKPRRNMQLLPVHTWCGNPRINRSPVIAIVFSNCSWNAPPDAWLRAHGRRPFLAPRSLGTLLLSACPLDVGKFQFPVALVTTGRPRASRALPASTGRRTRCRSPWRCPSISPGCTRSCVTSGGG